MLQASTAMATRVARVILGAVPSSFLRRLRVMPEGCDGWSTRRRQPSGGVTTSTVVRG